MTLIVFNKGILAADCCQIDETAHHPKVKVKEKLFVSDCNRLAFTSTGDSLTARVRKHFIQMLITLIDKHQGEIHKVVAAYPEFIKDFKDAGFPQYFMCITRHGGFFVGTGDKGIVEIEEDDYFSDGSNAHHADVLIPWLEDDVGFLDYTALFDAISKFDYHVTPEYKMVTMRDLAPWGAYWENRGVTGLIDTQTESQS